MRDWIIGSMFTYLGMLIMVIMLIFIESQIDRMFYALSNNSNL